MDPAAFELNDLQSTTDDRLQTRLSTMLMNSWSGTGAEHLQTSLNEYFNSLDKPMGMDTNPMDRLASEIPEYSRPDTGLNGSIQVGVCELHSK